jgi:filamentous hemagglutinin family protein
MTDLSDAFPGSRCRYLTLLSGLVLLQALLAVSQAAVPSAITGDGTLGTMVTQSGTIYTITEGTRPGNGPNLFHSFDRFSVGTGDTARFSGPTGITNILSRVTGGQPSAIDGRLQSTMPGANLYLLNPSGVLFGPNAVLDVGGSFHVSTADYLRFGDGATFAANLGQASVLTVAPPTAFGFLGQTPAPITIQGSALKVPEGNALSVVGGDLTMTGGTLHALSGRIQLVSVASPGEVGFSRLELAPELQVDSLTRLGRLALSQGALLDASGNGGGTVLLRGGHFLMDGSSIHANTLGDLDGASVGIDIRVAAEAVIVNQAGITTESLGAGHAGELRLVASSVHLDDSFLGSIPSSISGTAGNIDVRVGRLTLTDGARISSDAHNTGPAGDVTIMATDAILLAGHRITFPFGPNSPIPRVSQISSQFIGEGPGGRVVIVTPSLRMDEGLILANSTGRGGDIEVRVGRLTLTEGAQIGSNSVAGQGGDLLLTATESATIAGQSHTAELPAGASSRDGRAPSGVFSQTIGLGNGGRVSITTPRLSMAEGSRVAVDTGSDGRAGDIHLQVGTLSIASGAQITSSSGFTQLLLLHVGTGPGGNITIAAEDVVSIAGQNSGLFSETKGPGRGGDIALQAGKLRLTDGAMISATSFGLGNAGNLHLAATEVSLRGHSTITTAAAQASGGNMALRAGLLLLLEESTLSASVAGGPETVGGTLTLDAPFIISEGSQISAKAFAGRGGTISLGAEVFLADPASVVSASSELGISGTVAIQAPVTSLSGTLAPLPQAFVSAVALLPVRCAARWSGGKASSLVLGGRGGLPLEPGSVLPSPLALGEQLMADLTVTGAPSRQESIARFALLAGHEKTFPRLAGDCAH